MAVYAFWVVACHSKVAGCHTGHRTQDILFVLGEFVVMVMIAIGIWTVSEQIVKIAELHLFNSIEVVLCN